GFKFRSKIATPRWRNVWDAALFVGGLVPALVFGVAFGNALQGVPYHFDETMRLTYEGSFWALFNPFALLCGLVSVAMIVLHGATWLAVKASALVGIRARQVVPFAALALMVLFGIGGIWAQHLDSYAIVGGVTDGPSYPLAKQVVLQH